VDKNKQETTLNMSFATYKKNRTDLTQINKKVDEISEGKKSFKDSRFWTPTVNKEGSGSAKIRFLPPAEADGDDALPFQQYHEHNFEVTGSYFIELCPTTKGRECPVCKANGVLWKTEIEDNQKIVRDRKRKLYYVSNIYVVKDKDAPENEGKVFLYKYGQKIFEKIKKSLKPVDEEDQAINVFDLFEGADFSLEISKVKGYRNYDDSKFRAPAPLLKGDEKELEKVYNTLYSLKPFVDDSKFKSYEELEKKFNDVVNGVAGRVQKKADELFKDTEKPAAQAPVEKKARKPKETSSEAPPWQEPAKGKVKSKAPAKTETTEPEVQVENDDLGMYEQLVDQD
jgi:gp32 DNA binding protein like